MIPKYYLVDSLRLFKAIVKGIMTYIPGLNTLIRKRKKKYSKHSGSNAEFCLTLWLRILVYFKENNIDCKLNQVGEVGNGGSIGVGICALLSGSKEYYSLEIEDIYNIEENLQLLDEIVLLFKNRTPISDKYEQLNIKINDYSFPNDLINPMYLHDEFISEIKQEILNGFRNSKLIRIIRPWHISSPLYLDFIFSRAVMEHVNDPDFVYQRLSSHMKRNAIMLHDIELHSHGLTKCPNGHLNISKIVWKLICGKREYYLNRWTFEEHIHCIEEKDYEIIKTYKTFKQLKYSKNFIVGGTILAKKVK